MTITIIFISATVGLLISIYMFGKKISHKKLACPREHPCDTVLHSRFSKTFGVQNELLGAIYFTLIILLLLLPSSGIMTARILYVLFFLAMMGGLFSVYLVGLQAFVIRSWCAWCLSIAVINTILVVSILSSIPYKTFLFLFEQQRTVWIIVHNLGFILGIGAATITDIFFFRFLKDNAISTQEKETMDTLTTVIWVGLGLLVISGVALYVSDIPRLSVSPKFIGKVIVVGVVFINGILLNMLVAPHLRRLSFAGDSASRMFRRLAFALGGISITSWYTAFFLGSFRSIPITLRQFLFLYGTLVVLVVLGSQIFERIVAKRYARPSSDFLV